MKAGGTIPKPRIVLVPEGKSRSFRTPINLSVREKLAPSAAGPFPCSGRAWNFCLVQREGRRYRLMQREGKPSLAYPNAGRALLLAGLFLWSLLDDSKTNPRAQNCLDAEGPSFRMDKSAVDYRQLRIVGFGFAAGGSSSDRNRSRPIRASRRRRMMANAHAERLLKIPAEPSPRAAYPRHCSSNASGLPGRNSARTLGTLATFQRDNSRRHF